MSETKKRILFVDDEPALLAGLKSVLFPDRKRWDMVFANGATAALAELEQSTFDAVVSDMRMPGLDGATLLTVVKARFPSMVRIILSGSADTEEVSRAHDTAHEVLTKPCGAKQLRATLERLLAG